MAETDAHLRTYSKAGEASVGELAARLSEQVSRLVRDELALAEAEAKQKAKRLGLGAGMLGMGGMLALFGAACAIATVVLALAMVIAGWAAALIVSVALFGGAGMFALAGRHGMRRGTPPIPTEAVRSTKADLAAVREAVKQ